MLWRIRILRDVLFFCKLLRKWCVCMYMCVVWKFGDVYLMRCSHCLVASIFQDLATSLNSILLQYVCKALIFLPCDQVNVRILGG